MRLLLFTIATTLITVAQITSAEASATGRCGGTGGQHTKTLTCPTGQYIAGVAARGGLYTDQYSIACRNIPPSGSPGGIGSFMSAGPGGGTQNVSGTCGSKGHAVFGMSFKSGVYVDHASDASCTNRVESGWGNTIPSHIPLEVGGPGGITCRITCPTGEAMYQLTVKYGAWVDSVSGQCRR